jgi:hypothetical protein
MRLGSDLPVDSVRLVACPPKNRSSQSSQRWGCKRRCGRTARSQQTPPVGIIFRCHNGGNAALILTQLYHFHGHWDAPSTESRHRLYVTHARDWPVPAIVVVSAEIDESPAKVTSAQPFEELRRRGHSLWQRVKSLRCLKIESRAVTNDPKPLWEGSLILRMQSMARNPTEILRTFYTSDLDTMLTGNFLP